MDFIVKHFEKLLLVLCIVGLVYGSISSKAIHNAANAKSSQCSAELRIIARGKDVLPKLDPNRLDTLDAMLGIPQTRLELLKSPNGPSEAPLFSHAIYVICKNEECGQILPYETEYCPSCNTQQDPIAPETKPTDDLDKDGLPDLFEKASISLNYRNPHDALLDADGDGFLNIEEYLAKTDLNDAASFPPLGQLLRLTETPKKMQLPICLRRVKDGGGSTNPQEWKAVFGRPENKSDRLPDVKLAKPVINDTFTLVSFAEDKQSVVIKDNAGNSYTMELNAAQYEHAATARLVFLASRTRYPQAIECTEDYMLPENDEKNATGANREKAAAPAATGENASPEDGSASLSREKPAPSAGDKIAFPMHVGKTFVLKHDVKAGDQVLKITEYYLLSENESRGEVKYFVQRLNKVGGSPVGSPIELPMLNTQENSKDFIYGDKSEDNARQNQTPDDSAEPAGAPRR